MIRINLLPQSKKVVGKAATSTSEPSSQMWTIGYMVSFVIVCIVFTVIYINASKVLSSKQSANQQLTTQIARENANSSGLDEIERQIAESEQLEAIANDLQRARLGPTRVLMELSRILSEGGGPTIDPQRLEQLRREDPLAGYNSGWDPRRLWLTSFIEDNRDCKITGVAKTTGDVSEFLARLALSDLFETVTFGKTDLFEDTETHIALVEFEATCKVRY